MLSLGQAARLTNTSKTTITRAIKAGRLSALRNDDGSYSIDPSELSRVYEVMPETPATVAEGGLAVRHATPSDTPATPACDAETDKRLALAEAEIRHLREMLAEMRKSRDDWQSQAERITLALPAPTPPAQPATGSRGAFQWLRRMAG